MKGWVRSICSVVGKFTLTLCRLWNHWPPVGWIIRKERTCQGSQTSARCRAHCGRWGLTGRSASITTCAIRKVYSGAFKQADLIVSPPPPSAWRGEYMPTSLSHWLLLLPLPEQNSCCLVCRWTESKTIEQLMTMWGDESAACMWVRARSHTAISKGETRLLFSRLHQAKRFLLNAVALKHQIFLFFF